MKEITFQLRRRLPIISILLILSCLISTVPQFLLNSHYSEVTSQTATVESFYLFTLSSFTHSPEILPIHLLGNVLVFALFGVISEIIIGSRRFAFISILTLLSTTIVGYLHRTDIYMGHGASGIAWGYHMFYIFILIILFEHKGKRLFKDGYIIVSFILFVFDMIGIPIVEVVVLKKGFLDNFGQVLHLVSMVVVVPFIFIWRDDIEANVKRLTLQEPINHSVNHKDFIMIVFIAVVVLNIFGTYKAISLTTDEKSSITYEVSPVSNSAIENIPQKIVIRFDKEVKDSVRTLTSINYEDNLGEVELSETWRDSKTLEIEFNRKFISSEGIKLIYSLSSELEDDILVKDDLVLEY